MSKNVVKNHFKNGQESVRPKTAADYNFIYPGYPGYREPGNMESQGNSASGGRAGAVADAPSEFGSLKAAGVKEFVPAGSRKDSASSSGGLEAAAAPAAAAARSSSGSGGPAALAKEFVPGQGLVANAASKRSSSVAQLTPSAREFRPGASGGSAAPETSSPPLQALHLGSDPQHQHHAEGYMPQELEGSMGLDMRTAALPPDEPLVQVMQNGNLYYVTEAEAAVIEAQNQASSSVAAMQSMGLPEPPIIEASRLVSRAMRPVPRRRTLGNAFTLPQELRAFYAQQTLEQTRSLPPDHELFKEVPKRFHSIFPLDDEMLLTSKRGAAGSSGYPTTIYKVVSARDGYSYALRRVDNVPRIPNEVCAGVLRSWQQVRHASVVPLREAFSNHRVLFLVHDYYPGAKTLLEFVSMRGPTQLLPEPVLWSIITQLLSALRAVHAQGMACRDITPVRILMTGRFRARISGIGLTHILEHATSSTVEAQQQEDILQLGKVLIILTCMSTASVQNMAKSIEFMQANYSHDLVNFLVHPFKLHHQRQRCNVYDMLALASQGLLAEVDDLYAQSDALEEHLQSQFECDRLFRLVTKLSMITERPAPPGKSQMDSWSETDDRYIVKVGLFGVPPPPPPTRPAPPRPVGYRLRHMFWKLLATATALPQLRLSSNERSRSAVA